MALFIASLSLAFTADLQASESVIQLLRAMQQAWASGEFKKCVALGDKLIAIDSKFADAYYYRGCAKSQLHDSVSALKDLDYYCKNSKGSKIEPLTYKIQCYVDTQQWSKALECIDQANAIKPQGHLYKTKAQIYRQLIIGPLLVVCSRLCRLRPATTGAGESLSAAIALPISIKRPLKPVNT